MVALILNALFIVAFDLGIKAATMRKIDTSTMACVSYLFAVAFASVWLVLRQPIEIGWASAGFGVLNGVTYIGGLFLGMYLVKNRGVSATSAIAQLAILVPIIASVFWWNETTALHQTVGILIAVAAIVLLDVRKGLLARTRQTLRWVLPTFFVVLGIARLTGKAFAEANVPEQQRFYLWAMYGSAALIAVVVMAWRRRVPTREEWIGGAWLGFCGPMHIACLLIALDQLPGVVVFPLTASLAIVTTAAGAWIIFREPATKRLYAGIALTVVAVILLNWRLPA